MNPLYITSSLIGVTLLGLLFAQDSAQQKPSNIVPEHAKHLPTDRNGTDLWENDPRFPNDTFQFVRMKAENHSEWATDYPDSDLNFSFRLQQMTSLKVNPHPIVVSPTDPKLKECPFLYTLETATLQLTPKEITALREYFNTGGFLMIDDFWGDRAWDNTVKEMKKIFPDKEIKELKLDHPIFNIVFPIKEKPQIPAIGFAVSNRYTGITSPSVGGPPNFYGIYDDKGRMMVLICRNTDLGDGWEREGEDPYYFKAFSEKSAYPLGINIIVYMMTH